MNRMMKKTLAAVMALSLVGGAIPLTEPGLFAVNSITASAFTVGNLELMNNTLTISGSFTWEELKQITDGQTVTSIEAKTGAVMPANCGSLFASFEDVVSIDLHKADASAVTNMSYMFSRCQKLETLNLATWKSKNVTDMSHMLSDCNKLKELNLRGLNTSNVTTMDYMFNNCKALSNLDLTDFSTGNVTNMEGMFYGCSGFKTLNVSMLNTEHVTTMKKMFCVCSGLIEVNLSNFNTASVEDMSEMFSYCRKLSTLNLSTFNTGNVKTMYRMFYNCDSLTAVNLSSFNTGNVTNMTGMFSTCNSLTALDLSNFNTGNVTSMGNMFYLCESLTTLDLSNFNTGNVTTMIAMFRGCKSLTSLNVSSFNTFNVESMTMMFCDCEKLPVLDLPQFYTGKVTSMRFMFSGCSALTELDLSSFDTSSLDNLANMFSGCTSLKTIFVSELWSTDLIHVDTFKDCTSLVGGAGTTCDGTNDVSGLRARIDGGTYSPGYFTYKKSNLNPYTFDETTGTLTLSGYVTQNYSNNNIGTGIPLPDGVSKDRVLHIVVGRYAVLPKNSSGLFEGFQHLMNITFEEGFSSKNVTNMRALFKNCPDLTSVNLTALDTSNVTDMMEMFSGCKALTTLDLSNFNTASVTDMSSMFFDCQRLTSLDLSSFDTGKVLSMNTLFMNCSSLKTIFVSHKWATPSSSSGMFFNCISLVGGNGTKYDSSSTGYARAQIDGKDGKPGYFTASPAFMPKITAQPQDYLGNIGETAEFTVTATSAAPAMTYQWQFLATSGWKDSGMTGAKTATLSVPVTAERDGQQYRCVVTDSTGASVTSDPAKISVKAAITSQPSTQELEIGQTAKFTIAAVGKNLKYQWEFLSNTGWKNSGMTGANTATLSVPVTAERNGQQYRCTVTAENGTKATSNAASIKVKSSAAITSQPTTQTLPIGQTAKFTVAATGSNLTYQWQFLDGTVWKDSGMTGAKTNTLSVPVTAARDGQQYRCLVTSNGKTLTSNAASIKVKAAITTQPTNQTGKIDSTVKFTVAASGTNLKYQWQFLDNGAWKNSGMTGAQTATLSVPVTAARDGQQYRCVVTSANGTSATSNAAKLIAGVKITAQPKDYTGNVGATAKFSVTAVGNNLSYQWQFNDNGVWKDSGMTGAKTNTLSVPITAARNGQKYRCVVKSANGTSEATSAATLKVTANNITGQPQNATGKVGDTVKFTVTAANATYQWQFLATSGWQNSGMTGAQTATISVPVTEARDGQKYRCVVKFSDGTTKTSNEVSLKVQAAITAQPQNASGKVGATAKFTVAASGTNLTYQWQFLSTSGWQNSGMTGAKTATISVPITDARNGQQYRCIVTSGNGTNATSNSAKLTVTK